MLLNIFLFLTELYTYGVVVPSVKFYNYVFDVEWIRDCSIIEFWLLVNETQQALFQVQSVQITMPIFLAC